jgi:hypothetical protein
MGVMACHGKQTRTAGEETVLAEDCYGIYEEQTDVKYAPKERHGGSRGYAYAHDCRVSSPRFRNSPALLSLWAVPPEWWLSIVMQRLAGMCLYLPLAHVSTEMLNSLLGPLVSFQRRAVISHLLLSGPRRQ